MNNCGNVNTGIKLRGLKSTEVEENCSVDNQESSIDKSDCNILRGYTLNFICQRSSNNYSIDHSFSRAGGIPRNEFRMARGGSSGDRGRGSSRGRTFKKTSNDRDAVSESGYHSTSRPKYQESLKNQENLQTKYYDDKRINEDSRLSTLLRKLCHEDAFSHFMTLSKQVQEGIAASENQRYVRRSLDVICENLLEILHSGPGPDAKLQVSKILGLIGYVVDQDFKRYMDWLFNKYSLERKDNVKCYLMKSLVETLKMDAESPKLKDYSVSLMSHLQTILENVDRPDLLIATVDALLLVTESYPETFSNHFRDTVDILVGWHIDPTQPKAIIVYASRSLQKFRPFWIADLQFTLTLLGQFLEDMESYNEELTSPESGRISPGDAISPMPKDCILRITSLISAFNTVTKSISDHLNPNLTSSVQWSFLIDCLSKMLKTVVKAIEMGEENELWFNSFVSPMENTENLAKFIHNMNITQKSDEEFFQHFQPEELSEENLIKMIKDLNVNEKKCKNSNQNDDEALLTVEKEQLLLNLLKSMKIEAQKNVDFSEEKEKLIVVANECAFLLLGYLQSRVTKNHDLLYKYIDLQLKRIDTFWDNTIVSTLNIISKVIKEVSANLPMQLVHKLLGTDSILLTLRFRNSIPIQNASLGVYHSLLSLKNIPLLQESYKYILADLEIAYKLVVNDIDNLIVDNPLTDISYKNSDAEFVVVFILRALSDIANASNSIIGMWALKPSILELLAIKLKPYNLTLSITGPFLQYSIFYLLYAHCSRYNHFVPSSSLITGTNVCRPIDLFPRTLDVPTTSPTSGHLSVILNLIAQTFNKKTPTQTLLLLAKWLQEICMQAENYIGILNKTEEFQNVMTSLLKCGATSNNEISLAACTILSFLMNTKNILWPEKVFLRLVDLIKLHLTSSNANVRRLYGQLLMSIPLNIVMPKLNNECLLSETKKLQQIDDYSTESLIIAKRLHMRNSSTCEMQAQHFKAYMAFLLQEYNLDTFGLSEIFSLCWSSFLDDVTAAKIHELALANYSFLFSWSGFEAALHCVTNKLRTALGKPQETFTTIEGALKILAREISYSSDTIGNEKFDIDILLNEHTRVRLFIEFLEHLERVIYNAAEGCAMAFVSCPKPVRTFFHTNKSTCKEWLNRIRLALCVVSLHSGLAASALRNGQKLLEDLSNADNTQGLEFERATLCTAQAMIMLGEAEALQGLYVYTKEKDRKFTWLKAAMEEAASHYETAAISYKQIIDDYICNKSEEELRTSKIDGDNQVIIFCMQRLSQCYIAVSDWTQLELWKQQENEILMQEKNTILKKQIFENIVLKQAKCLKNFEENEPIAFQELSDWSLLNESTRTKWSCSKTLIECSNTLHNIALKIHINEYNESFNDDIELCQKIAAKTMEESLRNVPSEYLSDSILLQYSATGLKHLLSGQKSNIFELYKTDKIRYLNSNVLTKILWWSNYFCKTNNTSSAEVASLRLHVARSARKEGNVNLAKREILKYFQSDNVLSIKDPEKCSFGDITKYILDNPINIKWSKNNMYAFKELSKLMYSKGKNDEALKIGSITALGISQAIVSGEQQSTDLRETGTKLLLKLGKWINRDSYINDNQQLKELIRFEAVHNDGLMDKLFGETIELIPAEDMVIGKLMQLGVNQCPDLPLAWSSFAAWCYKWGGKIIDNLIPGQLSDIDKMNVQSLLPLDISENDLETVFRILSQEKTIPEDEGDIDTNDINTSEMIGNQLRNIPILSQTSSHHIGMLVDIWRQAQKRIYSYYELSANAYFKYLQLANKGSNDCDTITATLRLLKLIVKHAYELQNVLESGLSTTPTGPWKEIIPQLFSRLSHPESYVRTQVSELLCRVAENSPHLITFPAVVGAASGLHKTYNNVIFDKTDNDNSPSEVDFDEDNEYNPQDENQSFMDACFLQLVDCLSNRIHNSVSQVQLLVKELRRITLLWDELWLATLCQHHTEFTKKFEQLDHEIQRVQNNAWLSSEEKDKLIVEKHRIILKPIIFVLENLLAMTSVSAETPHEKNFQEKFGPVIEEVINRLKTPKNPIKPQLTVIPLKQLEAKLAQRLHRRSPYSLLMVDISPVLANLKDTCIAMPGVAAVNNKIVTIRSVDNNVQILPTKTKPKKLMFHGSDGHVYTYLFKGLEDLHLDERIMQFLSICNTMMSKDSDTKKVYRARHYSVIPLGPRSGLIQWVDGVTPLFVLYKRWQIREATVGIKVGNVTTKRPSELFYDKLTPLLKEQGISLESRKEWPLSILKQVLSELMSETPNDLLGKEIWCNSTNVGSWWQATKNYSYSVAVMSIIGYIIGLGDRHLDNVLVDLNTGEVVHIDYNVCFEKGKTLRVPEKVPFRLTQNIKTALGVTGIEGIFRLACEHTLRVMRRGRETLLTLLEAFVYDPLVDWRVGADNSIASYGACQARARCTGIGRKQLEQELTRAMFAVRIAEMRAEWLANRDELIKVFPLLCHHLNCWIETVEASQQCRDLLQDRHQQLALVKEAQAMGRNHSLYSVVKRYSTYKKAKDAHEKAKAGLKEKIDECGKQITMHNIALTTIRGSQLSQWLAELGTSVTQDEHVVFDLVKEFLQNAGQSQMILQCEQSENELTQLATQQSMLIRNCLELLSQYSAIYSLYPITTLSQHRNVLYHAWASKLLASETVETCNEVLSQLEANFNPINTNNSQVQHIVAFSYQIQAILNEANEKLKKAYDRMVTEGLPEAINRIEKAYTESKLQITGFLRREKGAERALECVNVTALCALNKRYLMMEGAAKCAGDCLVDLTSREGDWFLNEMRLMSSIIAELTNLIPENHKTNNDPKIPLILKCLKGSDCIYKGLQELNYNFHTIILPEAMKTITTEEPTVMRMINELNEIIISAHMPLGEILVQLERHLRFTVMEMESPHARLQVLVTEMRQRFEAMLSRPAEIQELNQEETLTPGQMLLMGFNGLFEKLQMEGNALVSTLSTLDIPLSWKKIDQIREAKEMAAPIFNKAVRQVLEDIFLIKRLRTIQEFFIMCTDIATAFKGGMAIIYDDERLNKPIKLFIADYVSRQLLGVTSQTLAIALCFLLQRLGLNVTTEIEQRDIGAESKVSLEELCRKLVDLCLKRGLFSGSALAQASALSSTLESAWRRKQSARLAQQGTELARATVQRLQLQLTAHHWLHEDSLLLRSNMNPMNPLSKLYFYHKRYFTGVTDNINCCLIFSDRSTFMLELRKTAAALTNLQSRVCEAREQQQNLVSSAVQRLKWAAGANPALGEVMCAFDNAVLSSSEKLTRQHNLAAVVINTCNSILHYEALRTRTSESATHDANFIKLIKHWEESVVLTTNMTITVSVIEESLVKLLQVDTNVDANWLKQAEKVISDAIIDTQKKLQAREETLHNAQDCLRQRVTELQNILTDHHRLMSDVRDLLKSMAKQDNNVELQKFLTAYRELTENISTIVKELESENLDPTKGASIKCSLESMAVKIPSLYSELLEFASDENLARSADKENSLRRKSKLARQESTCLSPRKNTSLIRDPCTGKVIQKRNTYALNVWRRVRMKLDGRDVLSGRKMTTVEQVDFVIREAQSTDNLALLYEGWTPWV
ncbi:serine/threonine-protein kinase SMG1 isoform X2 [Prorops nasuta]|uniref:serine/threonine-protein kinase SMG1 isoform X2 n=1 Tax=Prorops nasuta TaxID=863751 RepID=UPI0034CF91D0